MEVKTLFKDFPDHAQLWCYVSDRTLTPEEERTLQAEAARFTGTWLSHGNPVHADLAVLYGRFVVLAAYVEGDIVSGCGIDASTDALNAIAKQLGIEWLSSLMVGYLDSEGRVCLVPRAVFKQRAREGIVTAGTEVFDLTAATLGAFREGFLKRADRSWHQRAFRIAAEA